MNKQNNLTSPLFEKGLELIKNKKFKEAKDVFTQICGTDPHQTEAWYLLSTINGHLGEIEAAGECCRRVLEIQPNHCEARLNLSNVLYTQGRLDEAIAEYQTVLRIDPKHALAHNNLGNVLAAMGKYDEAAACYQSAIQIDPNQISAYINLGNLRIKEEKYEKAVNNFLQAIRLNPGDPVVHNGLGIALLKVGKSDQALKNFQEAARLKADYADAYMNIGNAYLERGEQSEALAAFRQALLAAPDSAEAHNNLGVIYLEKGDMDNAINCFQRALEINPQFDIALNNMGTACRSPERFASYLTLYAKTIDLIPNPEKARKAFITNIKNITPSDYNPWLDQELIKCFSMPDVKYNSLALLSARHLKHKYHIDQATADNQNDLINIVGQIVSDNLFVLFLIKTINVDPEMELLLTNVRRFLLVRNCQGNGINQQELKVASALAFQCLNNEYIFALEPEEKRLISGLIIKIEQLAMANDSPNAQLESDLFIYCMYGRVYSLSCRERLSSMTSADWSEEFRRLLYHTLTIPDEEENIKKEILTIGSIENKTSQLVRSQYEENPYPRWLSIPAMKQRNIRRALKQFFPHYSPPTFLDGPIKILVAGCGTGQQPIQTAMTYDNVDVLAVDISKSSLAYAIRMARRYKVENIQFMQGDILQLSKLGERFHIIECSGVLHHMENPLQGWKVLSDLLVNNGLMSIALYSEKARQQIAAAREIIQREQIIPDQDSIRAFRRRILRHEMNDTLYELSKLADFYATSPCRDLIFHFKEHRYTIPQLESALSSLDLEFIGFEFSDNASVINAYRTAYPQDKDMTNLALWDEFETLHPNTFAKMYDFWCEKRN